MKKLITSLAFISYIFCNNAFAQYGWGNPTTGGGTNHLNDVSYTSTLNGFAVGYSGTILKTTDGGENWTSISSGTTSNLFSISFASSTHGWAVGSRGTIRATTDGGNTWSTQTSGTGLNLESVYFTSTTQGWAVGSNGTIKATTNGGGSWVTQTSGTTSWLISVFFISSTQGWAVGNSGTIITTNDGGASWTAQTSGISDQLSSVYFTSPTKGWITTSLGRFLTTNDGGLNWTQQTTPTFQRINTVNFLSSLEGWASCENGVVLFTTDGGTSWITQSTGTTNSLSSVFMTSSTSGTIVGLNGTIKIFKCLTSIPTGDTLQSFCSTQNPIIADLAVSGSGIQWYAAATSGIPLLASTALSNANTYYASQTSGGCESNLRLPVTSTINTTVPSQPSINGSSTVCEGSNQTYSALTNKANSYTWDLPIGWSGSSNTSEINIIPNNSSGVITVIANNACGSSIPNTFSITVNPLPLQPSPINGSTTVCEGSSQPYSFFGEVGVTYNWAFPNGWSQVAGGTTNSAEAIVGSSSGDIVVTPSNSCGNGMYNILTVTVNPMPDVTVNVSGNTLTANQNGATSYQWLDCNNGFAQISGENNQSFNPTLSGSYAVEINLNGCIDQSVCEVLTITSVNENQSLASVSVYPNPNNGTFNISSNNPIVKVEVLNVYGQVVFVEQNITSNQTQINLNNASGIYFVRLTDENNNIYKIEKITKQ